MNLLLPRLLLLVPSLYFSSRLMSCRSQTVDCVNVWVRPELPCHVVQCTCTSLRYIDHIKATHLENIGIEESSREAPATCTPTCHLQLDAGHAHAPLENQTRVTSILHSCMQYIYVTPVNVTSAVVWMHMNEAEYAQE